MIKLTLNNLIKDLDGKDTDLTIGKAMANILLMEKSDPLRSYTIATKLYSSNEIEFSVADFEWVKKAIIDHGCEFYQNSLVSGQLLLIFSEIKE